MANGADDFPYNHFFQAWAFLLEESNRNVNKMMTETYKLEDFPN